MKFYLSFHDVNNDVKVLHTLQKNSQIHFRLMRSQNVTLAEHL